MYARNTPTGLLLATGQLLARAQELVRSAQYRRGQPWTPRVDSCQKSPTPSPLDSCPGSGVDTQEAFCHSQKDGTIGVVMMTAGSTQWDTNGTVPPPPTTRGCAMAPDDAAGAGRGYEVDWTALGLPGIYKPISVVTDKHLGRD
jgi:hypothetical protein